MVKKTFIAPLLALASLAPLVAEEGGRPFSLDLRAQAGLAENTGYQGRINLTVGNLFNDGSRYSSGLCLSARLLFADAVNATYPDADVKDHLSYGGGQFMGGLSSIIDDYSHIEVLVGGGMGSATEKGSILNYGGHGSYTQWAGEVGYYHIFRRRFQVGIAGGFSATNATLDAPGGDTFKARSSGIDVVLSAGIRL